MKVKNEIWADFVVKTIKTFILRQVILIVPQNLLWIFNVTRLLWYEVFCEWSFIFKFDTLQLFYNTPVTQNWWPG